MLSHPIQAQEHLAKARKDFCTSQDPQVLDEAYCQMHYGLLDICLLSGRWMNLVPCTRAQIEGALQEAGHCIEAMNQHKEVVEMIVQVSGTTAQECIALCERRLSDAKKKCHVA